MKLKLNGSEVEAAEGATVLDVCRQQGIDVPTMCWLDGHAHFTSCMICVVKNVKLDRLVPACSAPAADGMELETDTEEVVEARKVALELLLSEHVGDCEGPCERVCPAQIRIPLALRLLVDGKRAEAGRVVIGTQTKAGLHCRDCSGICEKPCRRGQVDEPVSIRDLMLYAAGGLPEKAAEEPREKLFNSVIGRLTEEEKADLLAHAEVSPRAAPVDEKQGYTAEEAAKQADRCLHCDCRKPKSCKLRQCSEEYGAKQSRYKGNGRKPLEIVRQHRQVIYEPGKCIKCGICVKITEKSGEPLGMAFLMRGYDSVVGIPFSEPLDKGLTTTAEECVRCCPTGALAFVDSEEA